MKKLLLLLIIILFISCGYRKDDGVYSDDQQESFYVISIFAPTFTNSPPIKIYYLPMEGINDFKVDSINKEADQYIKNCEKYTND